MRNVVALFALFITVPAAAAAMPAEGSWTCTFSAGASGRLTITGEHYNFSGPADGEGDLRLLSDGVTSAILDGPLSLVLGVTQMVLKPAGASKTLDLEVTGMFPARSVGSCTPI